jgi:hypothetical protein
MGRLIFTAILLAIVTPAAAQTADRLYLMDCGHNSAKDQARWSPIRGSPMKQPSGRL